MGHRLSSSRPTGVDPTRLQVPPYSSEYAGRLVLVRYVLMLILLLLFKIELLIAIIKIEIYLK